MFWFQKLHMYKKKHIYALASIVGSVIYYCIRNVTEEKAIGTVFAMLAVFVIRMFATKYCWELPKISLKMTMNSKQK